MQAVGIQIGVDGEAAFTQSIKNITQKSKELASELKAVKSAYDQDGKSSEALKAKIDVLTKQISNQQTYVEKLKSKYDAQKKSVDETRQALEQAKSKYGENSAEVQKLNSQLDKEETALSKTKTQMNKAETALNTMNSELQESQKELDKTTGLMGKLSKASEGMQKVGDKMTSVGKTLTATVTAPILGLGAAVVKTTADFESQMDKVGAISGATGDEMDSLNAKAREMGEKTKFSATEAGQAFEYMAMAGWKTEDMMDGVEGIMSLAAASGEDLATTSDIVTDALTAFGLTAEDSAHFADVLAAASSNANTNVGLLGESFKYVAPVAGAMGYSAEDTSLALGLMANAGIKASSAGTSLRAILTNMVHPSKKMQEAIDILGISLTDSEGNMKDFKTIMLEMRQAFKNLKPLTDEQQKAVDELGDAWADGKITEEEYNKGIEELLGSIEGTDKATQAATAAALAGKTGMSGLLAIVNASDEDFNKLAGAIENSEGAAADMSAIMQDNLSGQIEILMSQLAELAISLGTILIPIIRGIIGHVQSFVDTLNGLDEGTKKMILTIAGIAAVVGPIIFVIGSILKGMVGLITAVQTLSTAGTVLGPVIAGISAPMVGLVAAIAGAVVAGVLLYKNWDKVKAFAIKTWGAIKKAVVDKVEEIKRKITEGFEKAKQTVTGNMTLIKTTLTAGWTAAKTLISDTITKIKTTISEGFNSAKDKVTTTINELKNKISEVFGNIKTKVTQVVTDIKTNIVKIFTDAKTKVVTVITNLKSKAESIFSGMKTKVSSIISGMKTSVTSTISGLSSSVKTKFNNIKNAIVNPISKAKEKVKSMIDSIKRIMSGSISFPKIKLPHFSWTWKDVGGVVKVPKFSVDWYDKGGVFTKPSVIGVGERRPEFVGALDDLRKIVREETGAGVTINVYGAAGQDESALAEIVMHKLQHTLNRGGAVFA